MTSLKTRNGHLLYTPSGHLALSCGGVTNCCTQLTWPSSVTVSGATGTIAWVNGTYALSSYFGSGPCARQYLAENLGPENRCQAEGAIASYEVGGGIAYVHPSSLRISVALRTSQVDGEWIAAVLFGNVSIAREAGGLCVIQNKAAYPCHDVQSRSIWTTCGYGVNTAADFLPETGICVPTETVPTLTLNA